MSHITYVSSKFLSMIGAFTYTHPDYGHWQTLVPSLMTARTAPAHPSKSAIWHPWMVFLNSGTKSQTSNFPKSRLKCGLIWIKNTGQLSFCPPEMSPWNKPHEAIKKTCQGSDLRNNPNTDHKSDQAIEDMSQVKLGCFEGFIRKKVQKDPSQQKSIVQSITLGALLTSIQLWFLCRGPGGGERGDKSILCWQNQ